MAPATSGSGPRSAISGDGRKPLTARQAPTDSSQAKTGRVAITEKAEVWVLTPNSVVMAAISTGQPGRARPAIRARARSGYPGAGQVRLSGRA